jgi:hypothetical protein
MRTDSRDAAVRVDLQEPVFLLLVLVEIYPLDLMRIVELFYKDVRLPAIRSSCAVRSFIHSHHAGLS